MDEDRYKLTVTEEDGQTGSYVGTTEQIAELVRNALDDAAVTIVIERQTRLIGARS